MPSKYIVKTPIRDNYYHVFNRGVDKRSIFIDSQDYATFLSLLRRHLSPEPAVDRFGRQAVHLYDQVEVLAYCLMPNHFHLLIYTLTDEGLPAVMRSVMTAYSMYFNRKYNRKGTLFQGTYKASPILDDSYLIHISRYIHLNPQDIGMPFEDYPYSSYLHFLRKRSAEWLHPDKIMLLHDNNEKNYQNFVKDYESARAELKELKYTLADH